MLGRDGLERFLNLDLDVAVVSLDDRVAWYENADGAGTSWSETIIDTLTAANRIFVPQ